MYIIENDDSQVKAKVNVMFHGIVLPTERRSLCVRTAEMFSAELELPILTSDELYGSKLVAVMDRQHPRDFFGVWNLYESGGLSDEKVECFVTHLAGHNRPIHEVLFCNEKDIVDEYHNSFVGMTIKEPVALETLLETRAQLRAAFPQKRTGKQKQFLVDLANVQSDWSMLKCPHAGDLPMLRGKLSNLQVFSKARPPDFRKRAKDPERKLEGATCLVVAAYRPATLCTSRALSILERVRSYFQDSRVKYAA